MIRGISRGQVIAGVLGCQTWGKKALRTASDDEELYLSCVTADSLLAVRCEPDEFFQIRCIVEPDLSAAAVVVTYDPQVDVALPGGLTRLRIHMLAVELRFEWVHVRVYDRCRQERYFCKPDSPRLARA